jgi:hypothetical protein
MKNIPLNNISMKKGMDIKIDVSKSYLHNDQPDNNESKSKGVIESPNNHNNANNNINYMSNSNITIDRSIISSTLGSSHLFSTKRNQVLKLPNGDIFKGIISTNTISKVKVITGTIETVDGRVI